MMRGPMVQRPLRGLLLLALARAGAPEAVPVESRIRGAALGALVADALCLGSHYEYDAPTIKKAYGGKSIETYMAPGEQMGGTTHGIGWGRRNYHPGQKKGDQTDNGEYNLLMLEYLAARKKAGAVDLAELVPMWQKRLENWGAWKCTQTKQALQQVQQGVPYGQLGGNSNAMGVRSAGAIAGMGSEEEAAAAARAMMFTHKSEEALSGGEFFTRVAWKVARDGLTPREAIEQVAKGMSGWIQQQVKKGITKYEEATDPSRPLGKEEFVDDLAMTSMARLWDVGKTEPIKVGKASPTEGTMPSSIYIILKYGDDFPAAAKANAMVGGDNASRAVAIGMVLGAYHGAEAIPENLRTGLNAWGKANTLLDTIAARESKGEL
jgi:ADP-ribosylglycohydrolase